MNFTFSDDERMLAEAVDRFVDKAYADDAAPAEGQEAASRRWSALADLGLLGLHVDEAHGGMGRPATDSFLVMRAMGRRGVAEPYVSSAVVAARLIARGGSPAQQARWLPKLAGGNCQIALAIVEDQPNFSIERTRTRLADNCINGAKSVVLDAQTANWLLVPVIDEGALRIACIAANAPGVTMKPCEGIDGRPMADIAFEAVTVASDQWLEAEPACPRAELLDWALDHGRAALCGEAYGAMARLHELTLEHLKSRSQFGQLLGKFQVLQHRAVDMMILVEQVHSMALLAAAGADSPDAAVRRRHVSAAKALAGRFGRQLGEHAMHIFGAMGMTQELSATRLFKRLLAIELTWGDAGFHTDRYAAACPDGNIA